MAPVSEVRVAKTHGQVRDHSMSNIMVPIDNMGQQQETLKHWATAPQDFLNLETSQHLQLVSTAPTLT